MIPAEALLDAFVNANILFCVAYLCWLGARQLLKAFALKQAHGVQLQLLNIAFLVVLLAPFVSAGVAALQNSGMAPEIQMNLSDAVVAYYLNGGFEMKAADLEGLILLRDTFTLNVLNASGWFAQGLIAAFLVGFVIGSVRLACSIACLHRIVKNSYGWRQFGRVHIRLSDRTLVPFSTRGLRNFYVVLPSQLLGQDDQLKVSLAHEFQHIRQGDLGWEVLLEALKPFFFLNPCYHAWKRQVEELREFSCDHEVLRQGRISVRAYCDTLLSICQNSLRKDRAFAIAVPKVTLVTAERSSLDGDKASLLKLRILSALEPHGQGRRNAIRSLIAIPLVAVVLVATVAIQRPGDWSQDRLMLSTVVNLERLDEINRLSAFAGQRREP